MFENIEDFLDGEEEETAELEYIYWHTPYITLIELYDKYKGDYRSIEFHFPWTIKMANRSHIVTAFNQETYKYLPAYMFVENKHELKKYTAKFNTGEKDERGNYIQHTTKDVVTHHMHLQDLSESLGGIGQRGVLSGFMRCVASLERVRPGIHELIQKEFYEKEYIAYKEAAKRRKELRKQRQTANKQ